MPLPSGIQACSHTLAKALFWPMANHPGGVMSGSIDAMKSRDNSPTARTGDVMSVTTEKRNSLPTF
ncbi:MAG TPA: hypothetical protein VJ370_15250, partial [Streptosporangiaceae bacterium]|nr:hypothetical protein [Streptosporangiaceae bacterium]